MEYVEIIVDGRHVKVSKGIARILTELGKMHEEKMKRLEEAMRKALEGGFDPRG